MKPSVSVIIPNYNHARYLRERIDSVLNQRFQDYEIILLDDNSTDESPTIIQSYASTPHVTHIEINEQNSGSPFAQWDKGISLAAGEFIWIAESDDVADPNLLQALTDELLSHPEAVTAFAHSRLIDQEGKELPYGWHNDSTSKVNVYDGHQFVMSKMLTSNYIYNASMAVFRKSVYQTMDKSFRQYAYCGDWAFWIDLCLKGAVVEVCRVLNSYRLHESQATQHSIKTGGKWMEMGNVLKFATEQLHLSNLQRKCLRGRYTKRFNGEYIPNREKVLAHHREIFGGSRSDICSYEIGKLFNFLK